MNLDDALDADRYVIRGRPGRYDRPALPAGHPDTWGAITRGTVLEGSAYPFPVFEDFPGARWLYRG